MNISLCTPANILNSIRSAIVVGEHVGGHSEANASHSADKDFFYPPKLRA